MLYTSLHDQTHAAGRAAAFASPLREQVTNPLRGTVGAAHVQRQMHTMASMCEFRIIINYEVSTRITKPLLEPFRFTDFAGTTAFEMKQKSNPVPL